jgi:hypothetical protein
MTANLDLQSCKSLEMILELLVEVLRALARLIQLLQPL